MAGRAVACRLIGPADVEPTVGLMQRIGVHFGGSRDERVLRAVARDGVRHPTEVVIAVAAADDGGLSGLVVAFTERSRYWQRFARRHPRAAVTLAVHRLGRTVRRLRDRRGAPPDPAPAARAIEARRLIADRLVDAGAERWSDESSRIAKVMYVAVDPGRRQGGVGTTLYRWFFRHLESTGFVRCDAHVSSENVAALTLHRRFPFRFIEVHGGYFLWLLPREVEAA